MEQDLLKTSDNKARRIKNLGFVKDQADVRMFGTFVTQSSSSKKGVKKQKRMGFESYQPEQLDYACRRNSKYQRMNLPDSVKEEIKQEIVKRLGAKTPFPSLHATVHVPSSNDMSSPNEMSSATEMYKQKTHHKLELNYILNKEEEPSTAPHPIKEMTFK